MEWTEGRKLAKITYNNQDTTYEYNHEGLRTKKTLHDGSYILYDIVDGVYVGETRHNASGSVAVYIRYILDEGNSPVGISLWYPATGGWTDYHFIKNLQGDVLEVYKVSDGSLAASYTYDSWGNILSQSGSLASINPFRYRSYYYDTQTWFYYLQSRYYDPAIGRFLNADSFASTGQGILGNNMFAYCLNNPVLYSDSAGSHARVASPEASCFEAHPAGGGGAVFVFGYAIEGLIEKAAQITADIWAISKEEEKTNVYVDTKTGERKKYQYWEAARVGKKVVVGDGITFVEASARVAIGLDVMCINHDAAKWIVIINCYWNAVGPEIHGDENYYWHYHPNRHSHTHIWYYGG